MASIFGFGFVFGVLPAIAVLVIGVAMMLAVAPAVTSNLEGMLRSQTIVDVAAISIAAFLLLRLQQIS